jgi:hypothetical protein
LKYWLDTEFIEDGKTIDLVSIGVVSEDGRELYLQNSQCDFKKASDWVRRNVLMNLQAFDISVWSPSTTRTLDGRFEKPWADRASIANELRYFTRTSPGNPSTETPEFWGYYADYDWVALCQLFGTMMDLPKGWPMFCMDIKQLCVERGDPRLPEQGKGEHHALADARWNREAWQFLQAVPV